MPSHAGHLSENPEVILGDLPDAESSLRAWYTETKKARWKGPQDIKTAYRTASILRNNRVVFNIKGNTVRLVVAVKYEFQIVYVRSSAPM